MERYSRIKKSPLETVREVSKHFIGSTTKSAAGTTLGIALIPRVIKKARENKLYSQRIYQGNPPPSEWIPKTLGLLVGGATGIVANTLISTYTWATAAIDKDYTAAIALAAINLADFAWENIITPRIKSKSLEDLVPITRED